MFVEWWGYMLNNASLGGLTWYRYQGVYVHKPKWYESVSPCDFLIQLRLNIILSIACMRLMLEWHGIAHNGFLYCTSRHIIKYNKIWWTWMCNKILHNHALNRMCHTSSICCVFMWLAPQSNKAHYQHGETFCCKITTASMSVNNWNFLSFIVILWNNCYMCPQSLRCYLKSMTICGIVCVTGNYKVKVADSSQLEDQGGLVFQE